ncbi:MAG: hypothetical protein GEEBNDBF_01144 [bacterium]|nr:hypothetical protein [bacterium]
MFHFPRHFTLEEAREMLPWVRERMRRLMACLRALEERGFQVFGSGPIQISQDHLYFTKNGDGSHLFPREYLDILTLLEEIDDAGVQIKNAAEGLIDFPAIAPWGEEVLLCYLEGEDDIRYWHSLEGGFRGRRPVEGVFLNPGSPSGSASS